MESRKCPAYLGVFGVKKTSLQVKSAKEQYKLYISYFFKSYLGV